MLRHNGPLLPLECPKGVSWVLLCLLFLLTIYLTLQMQQIPRFMLTIQKIFGAVKCVHHDCEVVQTTLSNMDEWTRYNNIQFNISKCKVLTVTRKKQPVHYNYTLNNVQLTRVAEENDLGIIVTSTLSWVKHINAIVSKANKLLGLLKRTCPLLLNVAVRRTLYLSLVKSQLCFGTQVWSPSHCYLQGKIVRVQRRATRWILQSRIGEMSCKERLIRLDLLPLVYDRELKDITFFYKCLYGQIDLNVHGFVSFVTHGRTRLSNSFNLKTPICKTSAFQASYFNRIVTLCNFTCKSVPESSFSSIFFF